MKEMEFMYMQAKFDYTDYHITEKKNNRKRNK